jgi:hypothetical protein
LTSVEQALVDHVSRGERLDLAADDEVIDEAAMRSWGESRTCRATVIRDILRGQLGDNPDPHGLRLQGARITGPLDLDNLTTDVNLELRDCLLEEGVLARDARLASVSLAGCLLEHPAEPPLYAEGLTCSVLDLNRARIIGHADVGAVRLLGAHIDGRLSCVGARLRNDSGPALSADALQVGQSMFLSNWCTATGTGEDGAVSLLGAHIGLNLYCHGADLRNDSGPALVADGLQVGLSVFLRDGFKATGAGESGAVRLVGASIGGQLSCVGARLHNDSGPALLAHSLQVGQTMLLYGGFTATGAGGNGAIRLTGAHIGGSLECDGADLRNDSGPALSGDALRVDQAVFLRGGFAATGTGDDGAVRLRSAHIGGSLDCTEARLRNNSGPALDASSLQVGQGMYLRSGFTATGAGDLGAINLPGAHIGGSLRCDGAALHNDSGPGLRAFRLQVDGDMYLTDGFTATASGDRGAVRLTGARIGGSLDCSGAKLRNDSGPALLAYGIQVGQDIYLTKDFTATSGGDREVINLRTARVGGAFDFKPKRLKHTDDPHKRLKVDGLTYTGVPGPPNAGQEPDPGQELDSGQRWRKLLREGTPSYAAQPYQQLAAGYRARGEDRQARQILMAQRDDQLARTKTGRPERWWGKITKVTLGYGYQPWRALLFLAGVVALSCVLVVVLGSHGALAQTKQTATPGRPCTVIQQLSVGLDLNLPVGTSVARADCDLTKNSTSSTAAWLTAVGWVLRLLAWVFAALFIAGFTSAVRKT